MAAEANRARRGMVVLLALPLLLAGCGSPLRPFIQTVSDVPPEDPSKSAITMVEVCYNSATTTAKAVRNLAEEVCVKKGARAVFVKHRFMQCPLLQPASANFACR